MKRKLKMEVKREKTLLEIILNSTLVSTEIMKMKSKKRRVYGRLTKTNTEKGSMQQHLADLPYYRRYLGKNPQTFISLYV